MVNHDNCVQELKRNKTLDLLNIEPKFALLLQNKELFYKMFEP